MNNKTRILYIFLTLFLMLSCKQVATEKGNISVAPKISFEQEKTAILTTLNDETKAAFNRDYEAWQDHWVHDPSITKTYLNLADSTLSESVGWNEISQFVKTFIEEHPEPEPVPALVDDIDVRLYENGAWVSYQQQDSLRGLKRETRLMEKVNGDWKIAGMHTTIYGSERGE